MVSTKALTVGDAGGPTSTTSASRLHRLNALINRLEQKWSDLQVGRLGKYSVERLESLDHYCKTTSQTRALLVCLLTPLPVLLVVVLLECLPLRPPSEGSADWVFWARVSLMNFMAEVAILLMLKLVVPGLPLTNAKAISVATAATVCTAGFYVLAAKWVGFPIPFFWQLAVVPSSIILAVMLVLAVGRAPFTRDSPCRPDLLRYHEYFSGGAMVIILFPLFKVIYCHLPATFQGPAMILLPVWQLGAKKIMARSVRKLEDYMPQIVAFSFDFFSTLFVSVCMYSAGSITVSVLAISLDLVVSLLDYREVRMHAKAVNDIIRHHTRNRSHLSILPQAGRQEGDSNHQTDTADLLALILAVTRDPRLYSTKNPADVRLWACLPHPVPIERLGIITALEFLAAHESDSCTPAVIQRLPRQIPRQQQHRPRSVKVAALPVKSAILSSQKLSPLKAARSDRVLSTDSSLVAWHPERSKTLAVQGLQLLFHCEYLALVEYIESAIPLVFVTYKSVLHQLPNAVYYPGGAASWTVGAVGNILLFSILELGSLVALMMLLQRKFVFSSLHQLAFVLETQVVFVQGALFLSSLCLLPYELEHLGADFTLRFEWLRNK